MLGNFEFFAPESLVEASRLLKEKQDAKIMMGGTDLLILMRTGVLAPSAVVDLSRVEGIDSICELPNHYSIGAGVTHAAFCEWALDKPSFRAFYDASASVGTPQVRNIATVIGNLCNAVPSADLGAPALIFECVMKITDAETEKRVPASSFFTGPKKTILKQGEIVTGMEFPKLESKYASCYRKFGPRKASDLATVGVATLLALDERGYVEDLRIALGAVAPTPILIDIPEGMIGQKYSEEWVQECAQLASKLCKPISDFRASAAYRRHLVAIETVRALRASAEELFRRSL
ncbi:MAG: FAD binding domain-containing protein [Saccharofermentanales bacterium]|mgnify:CR=1 FL=1|jgi:CO/xanthine dehydrogenase FAD-binding subunit